MAGQVTSRFHRHLNDPAERGRRAARLAEDRARERAALADAIADFRKALDTGGGDRVSRRVYERVIADLEAKLVAGSGEG